MPCCSASALLQLSVCVRKGTRQGNRPKGRRGKKAGRTVQLQAHAVMDLVVLQRDVVLEHIVPERAKQRVGQAHFVEDSFGGLSQRDAAAQVTHHFWMRIFSGRVPAWGGERGEVSTLRLQVQSSTTTARAHLRAPPPASSGRLLCRPHCRGCRSRASACQGSEQKQCPRRRSSGDATHLHFTRIFLPCTDMHARRGRVSRRGRKRREARPQARRAHQSVVEHDLNHQRRQPPGSAAELVSPPKSQRLRGGRPGCPALTWQRATIFCPPVEP